MADVKNIYDSRSDDIPDRKTATERLVALARLSKTYNRLFHADGAGADLLRDWLTSQDRAVAYTAVCVGHELHKTASQESVFSPDLQERFEDVANILAAHVEPDGGAAPITRAALAMRAEPFADSLEFDADDEEDADELDTEISSALNRNDLSRYLLDRELGVAGNAKTVFELSSPDEPFTPVQARQFVQAVQRMQRAFGMHLSTMDYIFADRRDTVPWGNEEALALAAALSEEIRGWQSDGVLNRFDRQTHLKTLDALNATYEDSFFRFSQSDAAAPSTQASRKHARVIDTSPGEYAASPAEAHGSHANDEETASKDKRPAAASRKRNRRDDTSSDEEADVPQAKRRQYDPRDRSRGSILS